MCCSANAAQRKAPEGRGVCSTCIACEKDDYYGDCSSHHHAVYVLDRCTPCPWIAKIDGEFYPAKYLFTVDYAENEIADDPAQHKQSHVMQLLEAGEWTGNIVALPNNRVRVTHPAWFETGEGASSCLGGSVVPRIFQFRVV